MINQVLLYYIYYLIIVTPNNSGLDDVHSPYITEYNYYKSIYLYIHIYILDLQSLIPPPSAFTKDKSNSIRLTSHPMLPFYVSGSTNGIVALWQYTQPNAIAIYEKTGVDVSTQQHRITNVRINTSGNKLCALNSNGFLWLWNLYYNRSIEVIQAFSKRANDMVYLNGGSILGTIGSNKGKQNLKIWDILVSNSTPCIQAPACHPDGGLSISYESVNGLIISGGDKGDMNLFDMRQVYIIIIFKIEKIYLFE